MAHWTNRRGGIAWGRIALIVGGILPGLVFLYLGPLPDVDYGERAVRILATVLAILIGFLIAIITIQGDPQSLYTGSWRVASGHRRQVRRALDRFTILFYGYLIALILAFGTTLLEGHIPCKTYLWLNHGAMSFGVTVLIWSLGLPASIRGGQMRRLDEEVSARRDDARGSDGGDIQSRRRRRS